MVSLLRNFIAVTGVAFAAHAAAQVTFHEKENFLCQSFSTQRSMGEFVRDGLNDRAVSAEVTTGRWDVCDDSRLDDHYVVLRQVHDPSLAAMGLSCRVPTVLDDYVERSAKVSRTCLVAVARNRYSVPCELAGQRVRIRLYPNRVEIASDETIVASHLRLTSRGKISYDWQHYLALAQRNPAALRWPAFFADMSAPLQRWRLGLSTMIDASFGLAVATK